MRAGSILGVLVLLAGCVGVDTAMLGTPGAPVAPDQVAVMLSPPDSVPFETIALLEREKGWLENLEKVISELRKSAAELGADAIVLRSDSDETHYVATFSGANGTASGMMIPYNERKLQVVAIRWKQ